MRPLFYLTVGIPIGMYGQCFALENAIWLLTHGQSVMRCAPLNVQTVLFSHFSDFDQFNCLTSKLGKADKGIFLVHLIPNRNIQLTLKKKMARNTINSPLSAATSTGSVITPFEIDGQAAQAAQVAPPVRARPVSAQHASLPARVRQHFTRPAMTARDRWESSTRILMSDIQNLTQFNPDDQAILMDKMLASLESKHAKPMPNEFAEIFRTWRQDANTVTAGCNAANTIRFLSLIAASSKHYPVRQEDRATEGQRLQGLLDTVTATPHAPPVQKSLVRLVKAYCRQSDVSVADRVSILKELGKTGPDLHAAPINDLRTSHNVQGYAYKLMKKELARLPLTDQADVALSWARQNNRWCTKLRTLSGQHWKNIGYATAAVGVAGAASGGIAGAVVLGASGAAGVGVLLGSVIAKSVASGTIIGGAIGIYEGAKHDRAAIAARLTGGLPGAGFGIAAATSLTGADAHPITTTTSQVPSFETSFYVPDDHHPIAPGDVFAGEDGAPIYMHTEDGVTSFYVPDSHHPIAPGDVFAGEDGAPIYMHTERLPDATVTTHGIGSLPAAAIAAGVGAIGTGLVVGALSSSVARRVTRGATRAIMNAGGIRGVASKLRKNPVVSVQTAVQRTTANVFSINRLPGDERAKAQAVVALREQWTPWIETTLTLPPMRQAKIFSSLLETFQIENYHADDRNEVETAIAPARVRLMSALLDYNRRVNPLVAQ